MNSQPEKCKCGKYATRDGRCNSCYMRSYRGRRGPRELRQPDLEALAKHGNWKIRNEDL